MGNTSTKTRSKNKNVVRVSGIDGKTHEFRSPVTVKGVLSSHPNCYVGHFKEATMPLPQNLKLKVGRLYYLLPLVDCNTRKIKVVVTKQQLKKLMANQTGRVMDAIPEEVESG